MGDDQGTRMMTLEDKKPFEAAWAAGESAIRHDGGKMSDEKKGTIVEWQCTGQIGSMTHGNGGWYEAYAVNKLVAALEQSLRESKKTYEVNLQTQKANDEQLIDFEKGRADKAEAENQTLRNEMESLKLALATTKRWLDNSIREGEKLYEFVKP